MKKFFVIAIAFIGLLALYKMQHVQPVDNPKDSPLFQQRLQSSLSKFQEGGGDVAGGIMTDRTPPGTGSSYTPSPARTKELIITGRCGKVTLTWAEEKAIDKESITIKRKSGNEDYVVLPKGTIYDRPEEGDIRYWAFDHQLTDRVNYEYLVSYKDAQGKEKLKGPLLFNLTCTEQDREIIAQQEKRMQEYYQKQGSGAQKDSAQRASSAPSLPVRELTVSGRCGRVTLTWFEEKAIDKGSITIKRRTGNQAYLPLAQRTIYERGEDGGIRYWTADSELTDGVRYEYLISYKDAQGKEKSKEPVSIHLTCTEKDREILARQEKAIKEYYQKKGIASEDYAVRKTPPSYQLGKTIYSIELGKSPYKGSSDAPVTLVVFTDFECFYCSTWADTLDTIQRTFPNEVRIVFKNFLIPYHKNAEPAARAALAAGEQGKFWEMHDLLFKNQKALSGADLLKYAKSLNLDLAKFQKSLESEGLKKIIEQDKMQGNALGVQNAPTTFINGRSLIGSPPPSYIKRVIEGMLNKG